jgi:site-specific DNA-methyltransferase (adenine-specific)
VERRGDFAHAGLPLPPGEHPFAMQNTLYYGDNLDILRNYIADASVDLIYLDPPFNSNRDYNVLFKEQSGGESPAQIKAFGDTWNWAGAAEAWADFPTLCPNPKVIELMQGFHNAIGENDVMAYLVMMAPRLYQLHRVLKPTGSLYLHCDPTASAYLRLILDCIFGAKNFKNEIVWQRTNIHSDSKTWSRVNDTIFFYTKSDKFAWNSIYVQHSDEHIESKYRSKDETGRAYTLSDMTSPSPRPNMMYEWKGHSSPPNGWRYSKETMAKLDSENRVWYPEDKTKRPRLKRYLDEMPGTLLSTMWTDIRPINSQARERLGYPTQKPLALLERIINASSNPGDVVMDPFCGCGTAVVAAQKLGRQWIGIDVTPIATSLVQKRLYDAFEARDSRLLSAAELKNDPKAAERAFRVEGLPTDETGARQMFEADHKKFEMWAVGLIPAIPQEKKGADGGIDGVAYFDVGSKELTKAVVQVKGGKNAGAPDVQQLRGAMEKNKAALGFFITLEAPGKPMEAEALAAGFYKGLVGKQVRALQIRTIAQLLSGHDFDFPVTGGNVSLKQATAIAKAAGQGDLDLDGV